MSRCERLSFWSVQMFQPGASARLTSAMTIGSRPPAAQCSISCISARPCAEVAVNARAPAAEAPMQAAIAECSDSTLMKRAFSVPVGAHLGQLLDDLGLGRDRVGGDHLGARQPDAPRHGVVAHDDLFHMPSRVIDMAPRGHSSTHTPHPLQYL